MHEPRTPLWTLNEITKATGATLVQPGKEAPIHSVSIDSRSVEKDGLFIAIEGEQFDGHNFLEQATENGAVAALTGRTVSHLPRNLAVLRSPSPLKLPDQLTSLNDLAKASRVRSCATFFGITGSVGKTTTKEMLNLACGACDTTFASTGNKNNHIGAPLSLTQMHADTHYGIFEMGMHTQGEIEHITRLVRPHIAIITSIAPVHLYYAKSLENIAQYKSEIMLGLEPHGTVLLPRDNAYFSLLEREAKRLGVHYQTVGEHGEADIRITRMELRQERYHVECYHKGDTHTFSIATFAPHLVKNSVFAFAAAMCADLNPKQVIEGLEQFAPLPGRGKLETLKTKHGEIHLIDESYNSNPIALSAALETLGQLKAQRPHARAIAVLGDMLELDTQSTMFHEEAGRIAHTLNFDKVFLCGAMMKHAVHQLDTSKVIHCMESDSLIPLILGTLQPNDILLVKGSFAMKMGRIVNALKSESSLAQTTSV